MNVVIRPTHWLALAALLVGTNPTQAADVLAYVPNASDVIISLNLEALLGAPVTRSHLPALLSRHGADLLRAWSQTDPLGKQLVETSGPSVERLLKNPTEVQGILDHVRKSWTQIVLAGRFNGNDDEVLLVIQCDLDTEKFPGFLKAAADWTGSRVKAGHGENAGLTEVLVPGEDDPWFLALVEKGILVLSPSRAYVREALAKATGKQQAALSKRMSALLQQVDRQHTGWVAVLDSAEDLAIRGGFTLTDACKGELVISAPSEQAAKEQLEQIQADLNKASEYLKARAAEPLVEVVKSMQATRDGKQVTVKLDLAAERLHQMLGKGGER